MTPGTMLTVAPFRRIMPAKVLDTTPLAPAGRFLTFSLPTRLLSAACPGDAFFSLFNFPAAGWNIKQ
jgi:hypothetical protein